jgi:two-component system NtrC family sensor kinase
VIVQGAPDGGKALPSGELLKDRRVRAGASHAEDGGPFRLPVRLWLWLPLSLAAVAMLTVLLALVAVSWRGIERIRPVQAHLAHIGRIQDVGLGMERVLVQAMRGSPVDAAELARLRAAVQRVAELQGYLHPQSAERLREAQQRLARPQDDVLKVLLATQAELREVLQGERERHDQLLSAVAQDGATELHLALVLLVVLPLVGGGLLVWLRARIKQPLDNLGDLLGLLASRDYRPVAAASVGEKDGLVQPVFRSYNELVSRLRALEAEHRSREHTLEQEVRQATEALLAQSRELARAERLAAVGAVSAGLAHELRNPLAGIQMVCTKLLRSVDDPAQASRIGAVITELKRINNMLTEQVDLARHVPEPRVETALAPLVGEFLDLMGYQVPQGIDLQAQVPRELVCVLPVAGLRQALLNLVLNAVQAVGETGHVRVSASREDSRLVLSVSDDGPGFPEEMLRVGVRPFATGRAGGSGLGLAMVRRFTRDHDGELELANQQPRGARVTLYLPCGPPTEKR